MRRQILASKDELRSLRDLISKRPYDSIYDMLRKRCALILEAAPATEAQWRSLSAQGDPAAAVKAARTAQGRIFDLVIAHHIDPNYAYRSRAIEELKALCAWSCWLEPAHAEMGVDLCTAEAGVAAAVGLDWLYEDLSEADRLRVIHALRNRLIAPYRQAVANKVWWHTCYHSWNAVINSGCGLAALVLSDEEISAREAYQLAKAGLKHFFDAMGREGGWDEGIGYWGYAMRYVLLLGEAARRSVDDQSIFHFRGMESTGLFPIYFTPNGRYAGFGDSQAVPLYGTLYLLGKHFGLKELSWWLDTFAFHRDVATTDWSAAGLAMLFRPADMEMTAHPDLQPLKVFNEIGWASVADVWPRPAFFVAAKTGDLSANHSYRDMGSLNFQVDGQMMIHDLGLPPFAAQSAQEPDGEFYQVQAACHSTLLVGKRDHRIDAQGAIVEAVLESNYRWVACNAGTACGENVHYIRHLVMLVDEHTHAGKMLLVLDEVTNVAAERIDLFWHSPAVITLGKSAGITGSIAAPASQLHFAMGSNGEMEGSLICQQAGHRADNILHATVMPVAKAAIASVFSRDPLRGKIEVKRNAAGDVQVKAGTVMMKFKASKRHLQLQEVIL